MAFCKKCGAELKEEDKFCPKCGEPQVIEEKKEPSTAEGVVGGIQFLVAIIVIIIGIGGFMATCS